MLACDDELLELFNPECKTVAKQNLKFGTATLGIRKRIYPNSPESSLKFAKPTE